MKKAIILFLVLLLSFGFTTYAEQDAKLLVSTTTTEEKIPDKIDYKWALDQSAKQEKYKLMEMSNKISLDSLEKTLEDYTKMTDPIRGARTPAMRANNMVIMKYGIPEQKARIEKTKNSVQDSLEQEVIGIRNSLRNLYASKLNISYSEKSLNYAKIALNNAEVFYKNDTGTLSDVENAKYNFRSAEIALEDAKIAYENSLMSFNKLIGVDLLTTYKDFDIEEELIIKNTDNIKKLADKKYESLLKDKEYQIEKEVFRKEAMESFIGIYPNSKKDILEEIEKIDENIVKINNELEQMKFTQRRVYNEKAQSMIDSFEAIKETKKYIAELYEAYNELYNQYLNHDVGSLSVEQKKLDIVKAENNMKQQIYNFNTSYMSYLMEMEI